MMWFRAAVGTLPRVASAVWPRTCDAALAEAGAKGWRVDVPGRYCPRCGASTGEGGYTADGCAFCVGKPIAWDGIIRLTAYTPPLSEWVVAMKFHGDWSWATWFGKELAKQATDTGLFPRSAVCPVPIHFFRRFHRGYNQAELIARAFAKARGWPLVNLLRRTRHTKPQTSLPPSERQANVRDAFAMRRIDPTGWDIWLIDDVRTTGSTLTACTKLLRHAGARRIYVAVAAVADPKGADFKAI